MTQRSPEPKEERKEFLLSRRNLLRGSIAAAVLATAGYGVHRNRRGFAEIFYGPTEACRKADYIARTASTIEEVAYVNVDRHAGAKHSLVFLRQLHRASNMTEEERQLVRKAQAELVCIVERYMDDPEIRLTELLDEGDSPELQELTRRKKSVERLDDHTDHVLFDPEGLREEAAILKRLVDLTTAEEERLRYQEELERLEKQLREAERVEREREEQRAQEQERLTLSAARMLEEKRGLRILPAEEFDANVAASIARKLAIEHPTTHKLVMEKREKIVLEKAAKRGTVSFVLFGAAHDFRKEIDAWNREHPDQMFTLVEITPKTVREWEMR